MRFTRGLGTSAASRPMNSIGLSTTWVVPSSVFHLISYVRLESGADLVESPMKARETLEGVGGSQWIYAGKVVLMGLRSGQRGEHQWAAIVLSLYDSREAYDEVA